MPQIGPGKGDGFDGHEDFGRQRVTGDLADRHKFRTPSLRNVALTAPYGHSGAINSLEAVIRHYVEPVQFIENYDIAQAVLPSRDDLDAIDFIVQNDPIRVAEIAGSNELRCVRLKEKQITYLIEFLHALTDPDAIDLRRDVPKKLPSGLLLAE